MPLGRVLVCLSLSLLACTSKTDPPPAGGAGATPPSSGPTAPSLEGRTFLARTVTEGGKPRAIVEGTALSMSFGEGGQFGANAGCNQLGGRFAIEGGKLVVSKAMTTEMACPGKLQQESWYYGVLQASPTITVDGSALVLEGGGVRIEYLDRAVATPDLELVGPTWRVDAVLDAGTAMHAAWPKPATLSFAKDGTVKVDAGCNGGTARYSVADGRLTLSSLALTEMACADPLATDLEAAVARVFTGPQPVTWSITVDRLSLRSDVGGLDLVATPAGG